MHLNWQWIRSYICATDDFWGPRVEGIAAVAVLVCSALNVSAGTDTGMEGTHWVQFQPQQSMGDLEGLFARISDGRQGL